MGEGLNARIWLKMDTLQPSGSFKIRGIGHAMMHYVNEGATEFVAASGGNAGLATAYAGGTPIKIKNGVIKNPPPTPNKPERTPTIALNKSISTGLIKTWAIGKKTSI